MVWKKKEVQKQPEQTFDPEIYRPVLRCSICNGEQVAGFKNRKTGQFEEVMFIRTENDLELFKKRYGVDQVTKEY